MIEEYCISPQAAILDAMKKIDSSAIATVVVCENGKVKGVLTDGDIRRALINGVGLTSSIESFYTRNFISVGPDALRADVLELMQSRVIEQIPVVDSLGELKGIHTLHKLLGNFAKPNWAVIMAGGKGSRLGKLTENTPKPMLKVAGKPILERLVLHLVSHGIQDVFFAVNHLSHIIENYFQDGAEWGCSIQYLRESEPLGSGGALSLLPKNPKDAVLLMNGDLLLDADVSQMLLFHQTNDFFATMGVHYYSHEIPFGCVETDQNRLTGLEEKPLVTRTINGGVYVLSPQAIQNIPKNTFFPVTHIFEKALAASRPCGVYPLDGEWLDVGMPDQLRLARGEV